MKHVNPNDHPTDTGPGEVLTPMSREICRRPAVAAVCLLAMGIVVPAGGAFGSADPPAMTAASETVPADSAAPKMTRAPATGRMTVEQLPAAIAQAEQKRHALRKPDPAAPNKVLAEQWGVEVIGIKRTAGGYMLDFRFRVVDAEKALPLFDHRIKPYVVADKSDIKLPVPMAAKVGAFRPTNRGRNIKADKTYYMMFGNPDSHVKPGETVSVVIGDFKVEHLTVN